MLIAEDSAAGADLPEGNGWELILDFWMEIMYDIKQAVRENGSLILSFGFEAER